MENWKRPSLIAWPRRRQNKPKEIKTSDMAAPSPPKYKEQGFNETLGGKTKKKIKSVVLRTIRSTRTLFKIGRKSYKVPEIPSDTSRVNAETSTLSIDSAEESTFVLRKPNSSPLNSTVPEWNSTIMANYETPEQSRASQRLQSTESTALAETTINSRTSIILSVGKSNVLSMVKNKSLALYTSSTRNKSNQLASSSTKPKSDINSQSPMKTPASSSKVHSSPFTQPSDVSRSPCRNTGSDLSFSPISSNKDYSAHTSVNFQFNDPEPKKLKSEIPFASSSLVRNQSVDNATINNPHIYNSMPHMSGKIAVESPVSRSRSVLAEQFNNLASRISSRPPRFGKPGRLFSRDGNSLTFKEFCKSQCQISVVTLSISPISNDLDRPPALPPKLHKGKFCNSMILPSAFHETGYDQPKRPISLPYLAHIVTKGISIKSTPDNDYDEIDNWVEVRSPARKLELLPLTEHQIVAVPGLHENSPSPPPLPPRCPRMVPTAEMHQRYGDTATTSYVNYPPPVPPRSPTIRLAEAVADGTRSNLGEIFANSLSRSLDAISSVPRPNSRTIATQTLPVRKTVATQTILSFLARPMSEFSEPTTEVNVILPEDTGEPGIYLPMNGC